MNNLLKILIPFFIVLGLDADQGMMSFDVVNDRDTVYTTSNIVDMSLDGNNIYTISSSGVQKFDKNSTSAISSASSIGSNLSAIIARDSKVYILEVNEIKVLNSDLNVTLGDFNSTKNVNTFLISESYLYLGTTTGVSILDISDDSDISQVAFIETTNVQDLVVKKDSSDNRAYLYVADEWGGLKVLDISNPLLTKVSSTVEGVFYKVSVENNYLYTIDSSGMSIYDISSPLAPVYKSTTSFSVDKDNCDILVFDAYAYVNYYDGVSSSYATIDVSNKLDTNGSTHTLSAIKTLDDGSDIYIATSNGVERFKVNSDFYDVLEEIPASLAEKTTELEADNGVFGSLKDPGDIDYIKIKIPSGKFIGIITGMSDLNVSIYDINDSSVTPLATATSENSSKTLEIEADVSSGIHYLKIQSTTGSTGEYKIVASSSDDDWTDIKGSAYLINYGEDIEGNMLLDTDKDYFRVDLSSKGILTIESPSFNVVDFEIENSYDSTAITAEFNDDGSKSFIVPSSGTHYIKVKAASENIDNQDYSFKVDFSKAELLETEDDASLALQKISQVVDSGSNYRLIKSEGPYLYVVNDQPSFGNGVLKRKNKADLSDTGNEFEAFSEIIDYVVSDKFIYLIDSNKFYIIQKENMSLRSSISSSSTLKR